MRPCAPRHLLVLVRYTVSAGDQPARMCGDGVLNSPGVGAFTRGSTSIVHRSRPCRFRTRRAVILSAFKCCIAMLVRPSGEDPTQRGLATDVRERRPVLRVMEWADVEADMP